jgi:hypothetical protein
MVLASRTAAGANATGSLSRVDRTLGSNGQRHRCGDIADDDAGRTHRRRPRFRLCDPPRALTALLIAAPFALYLLHRAGTPLGEAGRRSAALLVMAVFVFGLPFADSGFSGIAAAEAVGFAVVALLAIWLTYLGFGSIALWAFRFAWVQFGALGTLMSRALPLLMITVVVYFTGELWQLAARLTRQRLWQTIGFLALVALIFMVTTIRDEVRALREDRAEQSDPA